MRDVFFTILVIWVLWRIFSGVKRSGNTFTFNTYNDNSQNKKSKEGEVTIDVNSTEKKQKKVDEGEYVDFEEIKNK